jgi:hypothetical protein
MKKQIFEDFLAKLEAEKVPTEIIAELRLLWEKNELESKEKILNLLNGVVPE